MAIYYEPADTSMDDLGHSMLNFSNVVNQGRKQRADLANQQSEMDLRKQDLELRRQQLASSLQADKRAQEMHDFNMAEARRATVDARKEQNSVYGQQGAMNVAHIPLTDAEQQSFAGLNEDGSMPAAPVTPAVTSLPTPTDAAATVSNAKSLPFVPVLPKLAEPQGTGKVTEEKYNPLDYTIPGVGPLKGFTDSVRRAGSGAYDLTKDIVPAASTMGSLGAGAWNWINGNSDAASHNVSDAWNTVNEAARNPDEEALAEQRRNIESAKKARVIADAVSKKLPAVAPMPVATPVPTAPAAAPVASAAPAPMPTQLPPVQPPLADIPQNFVPVAPNAGTYKAFTASQLPTDMFRNIVAQNHSQFPSSERTPNEIAAMMEHNVNAANGQNPFNAPWDEEVAKLGASMGADVSKYVDPSTGRINKVALMQDVGNNVAGARYVDAQLKMAEAQKTLRSYDAILPPGDKARLSQAIEEQSKLAPFVDELDAGLKIMSNPNLSVYDKVNQGHALIRALQSPIGNGKVAPEERERLAKKLDYRVFDIKRATTEGGKLMGRDLEGFVKEMQITRDRVKSELDKHASAASTIESSYGIPSSGLSTRGSQLTPEIAAGFLRKAGGDKSRAKQLAAQAGY